MRREFDVSYNDLERLLRWIALDRALAGEFGMRKGNFARDWGCSPRTIQRDLALFRVLGARIREQRNSFADLRDVGEWRKDDYSLHYEPGSPPLFNRSAPAVREGIRYRDDIRCLLAKVGLDDGDAGADTVEPDAAARAVESRPVKTSSPPAMKRAVKKAPVPSPAPVAKPRKKAGPARPG